jgi:hypothetical protein
MILTMSHWSSGLTCLLPATKVTGSNPLRGVLIWNWDSLVSLDLLRWFLMGRVPSKPLDFANFL